MCFLYFIIDLCLSYTASHVTSLHFIFDFIFSTVSFDYDLHSYFSVFVLPSSRHPPHTGSYRLLVLILLCLHSSVIPPSSSSHRFIQTTCTHISLSSSFRHLANLLLTQAHIDYLYPYFSVFILPSSRYPSPHTDAYRLLVPILFCLHTSIVPLSCSSHRLIQTTCTHTSLSSFFHHQTIFLLTQAHIDYLYPYFSVFILPSSRQPSPHTSSYRLLVPILLCLRSSIIPLAFSSHRLIQTTCTHTSLSSFFHHPAIPHLTQVHIDYLYPYFFAFILPSSRHPSPHTGSYRLLVPILPCLHSSIIPLSSSSHRLIQTPCTHTSLPSFFHHPAIFLLTQAHINYLCLYFPVFILPSFRHPPPHTGSYRLLVPILPCLHSSVVLPSSSSDRLIQTTCTHTSLLHSSVIPPSSSIHKLIQTTCTHTSLSSFFHHLAILLLTQVHIDYLYPYFPVFILPSSNYPSPHTGSYRLLVPILLCLHFSVIKLSFSSHRLIQTTCTHTSLSSFFHHPAILLLTQAHIDYLYPYFPVFILPSSYPSPHTGSYRLLVPILLCLHSFVILPSFSSHRLIQTTCTYTSLSSFFHHLASLLLTQAHIDYLYPYFPVFILPSSRQPSPHTGSYRQLVPILLCLHSSIISLSSSSHKFVQTTCTHTSLPSFFHHPASLLLTQAHIDYLYPYFSVFILPSSRYPPPHTGSYRLLVHILPCLHSSIIPLSFSSHRLIQTTCTHTSLSSFFHHPALLLLTQAHIDYLYPYFPVFILPSSRYPCPHTGSYGLLVPILPCLHSSIISLSFSSHRFIQTTCTHTSLSSFFHHPAILLLTQVHIDYLYPYFSVFILPSSRSPAPYTGSYRLLVPILPCLHSSIIPPSFSSHRFIQTTCTHTSLSSFFHHPALLLLTQVHIDYLYPYFPVFILPSSRYPSPHTGSYRLLVPILPCLHSSIIPLSFSSHRLIQTTCTHTSLSSFFHHPAILLLTQVHIDYLYTYFPVFILPASRYPCPHTGSYKLLVPTLLCLHSSIIPPSFSSHRLIYLHPKSLHVIWDK